MAGCRLAAGGTDSRQARRSIDGLELESSYPRIDRCDTLWQHRDRDSLQNDELLCHGTVTVDYDSELEACPITDRCNFGLGRMRVLPLPPNQVRSGPSQVRSGAEEEPFFFC